MNLGHFYSCGRLQRRVVSDLALGTGFGSSKKSLFDTAQLASLGAIGTVGATILGAPVATELHAPCTAHAPEAMRSGGESARLRHVMGSREKACLTSCGGGRDGLGKCEA